MLGKILNILGYCKKFALIMQGCKNEKLDKWDVKEEHSLKKQHKLSQFGSESKIFVRDIPEIPFNYLP